MKKFLSIIVAVAIVTTFAPPPLLTLNTFAAEPPMITLSGTGTLTMLNVRDALGTYGNYATLVANVVIEGYTEIGSNAFAGCAGLTSITIPNDISVIHRETFYQCTSLTSINIPNGVTLIGEAAFYQCESLTSVALPNSIITIKQDAFAYCTSLTSITIPGNTSTIGEKAFIGCESLTSVVLPNSVTTIGNLAFSNCTSLNEIVLPNSIVNMGVSVFGFCTSLTKVILPNSIATIQSGMFAKCAALNDVAIPNSVKVIKEDVFLDCTALSSVVIPSSVTDIYASSFKGWTAAQTIYMKHTDASQLTWTNPPTEPTIVWNYGYTPQTHTQSSETPLTLELRKTVLDITQPTQISVVIDPNEAGLEIISDDYYIQSNNNCKVNVEMVAFDLSDSDESGYSVVPPNSETWATLPATQKKLALGLQHANTSELSNGVSLTNGTVWSTDLSTPIEVCSISANKRATFNIIAQHGYSVKEPTTIKLEIIPRIYAA